MPTDNLSGFIPFADPVDEFLDAEIRNIRPMNAAPIVPYQRPPAQTQIRELPRVDTPDLAKEWGNASNGRPMVETDPYTGRLRWNPLATPESISELDFAKDQVNQAINERRAINAAKTRLGNPPLEDLTGPDPFAIVSGAINFPANFREGYTEAIEQPFGNPVSGTIKGLENGLGQLIPAYAIADLINDFIYRDASSGTLTAKGDVSDIFPGNFEAGVYDASVYGGVQIRYRSPNNGNTFRTNNVLAFQLLKGNFVNSFGPYDEIRRSNCSSPAIPGSGTGITENFTTLEILAYGVCSAPQQQPTRTGPGVRNTPEIPSDETDIPEGPQTDKPDFPELDIPDFPELDLEQDDDDRPPTSIIPVLPEFPDLPDFDITNPEIILPPNTAPESSCCSEPQKQDLAAILDYLNNIWFLLNQGGIDNIDVSPCGGDEVNLISWQGSAISGLYTALGAMGDALEVIHDNTKCSDTESSIPMVFESKAPRGIVSQLSVLFGPTSGGSSRWSLCIPHPTTAASQPDFNFQFPVYTKGTYQATHVLQDNTKIILNAKDKQQASTMMQYCLSLVEPSMIGSYPDPVNPFKGTEGATRAKVIEVKAVYIKMFQGSLDTPPIWATSLVDD